MNGPLKGTKYVNALKHVLYVIFFLWYCNIAIFNLFLCIMFLLFFFLYRHKFEFHRYGKVLCFNAKFTYAMPRFMPIVDKIFVRDAYAWPNQLTLCICRYALVYVLYTNICGKLTTPYLDKIRDLWSGCTDCARKLRVCVYLLLIILLIKFDCGSHVVRKYS